MAFTWQSPDTYSDLPYAGVDADVIIALPDPGLHIRRATEVTNPRRIIAETGYFLPQSQTGYFGYETLPSSGDFNRIPTWTDATVVSMASTLYRSGSYWFALRCASAETNEFQTVPLWWANSMREYNTWVLDCDGLFTNGSDYYARVVETRLAGGTLLELSPKVPSDFGCQEIIGWSMRYGGTNSSAYHMIGNTCVARHRVYGGGNAYYIYNLRDDLTVESVEIEWTDGNTNAASASVVGSYTVGPTTYNIHLISYTPTHLASGEGFETNGLSERPHYIRIMRGESGFPDVEVTIATNPTITRRDINYSWLSLPSPMPTDVGAYSAFVGSDV